MRIEELLYGVEILDTNICMELEIEGVASDSRKIRSNYLFIAIKGENKDGNEYIREAINNGAVAVITTKKTENLINYIIVKDDRLALAQVWNNYYKSPGNNMTIIAITGTNGKTTTAHVLYSILKETGEKCGLISTVHCLVNDEPYDTKGGSEVNDKAGAMTTPDPEIFYKILSYMKEKEVKYLIIEATSHALSLKKLDPMPVTIGMFLNISQDHLDFHKDMDKYFEAKQRLAQLSNKMLINIDSEYGEKMLKEDSFTFSKEKKADFALNNITNSSTGSTFFLKNGKNKIKLSSLLLGDFMPENIGMAVSCALLLNIKHKHIKRGVRKCDYIPGRIEKIQGKNIYIDFAHSPAAMERILKYFKSVFPNKKIIVLFGCGGDRDKTKRKIMGEIASRLADEIIITSDNSRNESPSNIINNIKEGIVDSAKCICIENRKEAILYAVKKLKKNEVLLLLGKGHENYEIIGNKKTYFNEKEIVYEGLKNDKNS